MHGNYWLYIKTVVILIFLCACDIVAAWNTLRTTRDLKIASQDALAKGSNRTGRGFFPHGGIFSLGKVLNFFPVGGERECQPSGVTLARAGICLNPYDCRQRDGKAAGDCAHGLGVCCVFEVSCGGTVQNNLTYFLSPGFPELWSGERDCSIKIEKSHAGIMQLRIDFVHFTIGQPNRSTGECDEDVMMISDGDNKSFTICGQNHGQHLYYTLSTSSESREADELPRSKATTLSIRMRGADMPRLWMLRIAQMPLAHSAPHECLQYHTDVNGTIKTFNYAINGRHLTGQEYKACVRRNIGFCSIRYSPCDARSFRVGPSIDGPQTTSDLGPGSQGGAGTGFYGPEGAYLPPNIMASIPDQQVVDTQNGSNFDNPDYSYPVLEDGMMPADVQEDPETQADEMEGSGADPQIASTIEAPQPSLMSRIWNYIWPWSWSQRSWSWTRWSPYAQHYQEVDDQFPYRGYGNFGMGLQGRYGRQRCKDRITIPCDNEYFVSSSPYSPGVCDPHHCGGSFCPGQNYDHCHVETSITPFSVSFHFGPPTVKSNPEENIGACLKYTQLPCEA